jgi:NitT/TauT family transport system substrate-binding protein
VTRWVILLVLVCCHRPPSQRLRLGFFPTLTHAAALIALERGSYQFDHLAVSPKAFASGPEAIEALFAGELDAAFVGPMPALSGFQRSDGRALVVIAGAASGGAALVMRPHSSGQRLASPQLANTQDVALRTWLRQRGQETSDRGGTIEVLPLHAADILTLMTLGKLDGAWVPEPWVTRLCHEAGAQIVVDDRDFWPGMPSTLLVVSRPFYEQHRGIVDRLLAAHEATVAWAKAHPAEAQKLAARAIVRHGGKPLPPALMAEAWTRVELTTDPRPDQLAKFAAAARALGYLDRDLDVKKLLPSR